MTTLELEHDHTCRVEWTGTTCRVTIEAWELARAYDRAARMRGVEWGPCLLTLSGTWKMEGVSVAP